MNSSDPGSTSVFPATRWTLIGHLRDDAHSHAARHALEQLCSAYWYPLYVYARKFGLNEDDARDAVQDLFARMIEGNSMALAQACKGRLRNFLLTSLKNSMAHERERQSAVKRGGGAAVLSLDMTDAEGRYVTEPASTEADPEQAFEKKWALELLQRTRDRLRASYALDGREAIYDHLAPALSEGERWQGHAQAALALGMNEGAVKVALFRLRKRFAEALKGEVAAPVEEDGDVREELGYLARLFSV